MVTDDRVGVVLYFRRRVSSFLQHWFVSICLRSFEKRVFTLSVVRELRNDSAWGHASLHGPVGTGYFVMAKFAYGISEII